MEQTLLFLFFCCAGFVSGYGVREMISLRRRREARKMREARERLMQLGDTYSRLTRLRRPRKGSGSREPSERSY
jgi:hypothetical protein